MNADYTTAVGSGVVSLLVKWWVVGDVGLLCIAAWGVVGALRSDFSHHIIC